MPRDTMGSLTITHSRRSTFIAAFMLLIASVTTAQQIRIGGLEDIHGGRSDRERLRRVRSQGRKHHQDLCGELLRTGCRNGVHRRRSSARRKDRGFRVPEGFHRLRCGDRQSDERSEHEDRFGLRGSTAPSMLPAAQRGRSTRLRFRSRRIPASSAACPLGQTRRATRFRNCP